MGVSVSTTCGAILLLTVEANLGWSMLAARTISIFKE